MRAEATPVPIPNTTVKIRAADGTMLETAWESRRLPDIFIKHALHAMSVQEGADKPFLNADGVQNAADAYPICTVHTLKTE